MIVIEFGPSEYMEIVGLDQLDKVLSGKAYLDTEIEILDWNASQSILNIYTGNWMAWDPKHPRCLMCGKFYRKGKWWKGSYTGPCIDCDEATPW